MKEGIFLHNTQYVKTDSFGSWAEQSPSVGFVNYGSEGQKCYSYDEIEELLNNGFIDENISIDKEGKPHLKSQFCSYCNCFTIVCGRVIEDIEESYQGIYNYCKKINLIHKDFIPIIGWFGTKEMKENEDNTFNIYYTFNDFETNGNIELAEKICVGKIKKLAGERNKHYSYSKKIETIEKSFECKDVKFNKENKQLIIENISKEYITGNIVDTIIELDLELWILFNKNKYWGRFFKASIESVRDMGQVHWFDKEIVDVDKDINRNINWYEQKLGEEWNDL